MQIKASPSRFRWLGFILFFLLIYVEITIFVAVADELGVLSTLLLTFLTSVLGVSLVKNEGLRNLMNIQQKLAGHEDPSKEVIKSFALLISGVLLFIPGFFTDLIGLFLLLPFIQRLVINHFLPYVRVAKTQSPFDHSSSSWYGTSSARDENTFDAEFTTQADPHQGLEDKEKRDASVKAGAEIDRDVEGNDSNDKK